MKPRPRKKQYYRSGPKIHILLPRWQYHTYLQFYCKPKYRGSSTTVGMRMYISHQAYREMIKSPQMRAALQLQPICSVCHNQFMQMLYEAYPELHFSVTRKWVET